jgi:microcystin-dependent protein
MEGYIAQIIMFAGNFAPRNWAFCQGQILAISQNSALFALIGVFYGGNGTTTFALPDLRGRVPVGAGTGAGLSNIVLGQISGAETTTLTANNLPAHTHTVSLATTSANGDTNTANGNMLATAMVPAHGPVPEHAANIYKTGGSADGSIAAGNTGSTGSNLAFSIRNPFLGMNYVICLAGIFPSQS